jgi:trimeric autotransporter adhesin
MKRGLNHKNSLPDPEFGRESSESARAIHYVVQKDTLMTYVSALIAQAEPGIVSGSTIERKKMSTKTIYKRIALVAVAALGAGLLSVAPANAGGATPVISDPTDGYVATGSAYTASTTISYTGDNSADTGTLSASVSGPTGNTATTVTFGTATGVTANSTFTPGTGVLAQLTGANGSIAATVPLSFTPTIAGTYTITLTMTATGTATQSYTVRAAGLAYSLGDGAAVSPATSGNGIAGPANTVTVNATANASNTRSLVTVSGAGATINSNAGTALTAGVTSTIVAAGTDAAIIINTPTAGTVTVSQFYESGNGTGIYASTASKTVTITVGTAAVNGTLSVANSTSILDGTIGADNEAWSSITADETAIKAATASTSIEVAVIRVVLQDTLKNVMPNATGISATITGPGLLSIGTTQQSTAVGRAVSSSTLASGTGTAFVSVYADGTPGVATITISQGTTVVATERVTFYGDAARYTATTNIVAAANGTTSTDVVTVCAVDTAGVVVPGATIYAFSGDTTVATIASADASGDATEATAIPASGTSMADHVAATAVGCVGFSIDALSQTTKPSVVLTFGNATTIAASTVTATATVLVGSVAATTVALTADKASYAPGEAVVLTLTYRDSVGRPVAHGPGTGTLAAALASSSSLGTTALFATANSSKLGSTRQTVYAPLTAGSVTVTGTTGADSTYLVTAARGAALTASFTVAVPANAEIASLTTLVNSLIAKINALNRLVIKIQKKVRA